MSVPLPFHFDAKLDLGHLLTLLTVLISVATVLRSWAMDRRLGRQRQADQIRLAAAGTLAKIERWRRISLWFFEELQTELVQTSELLASDFDVVKARDFLWKRVHAVRFATARRALDEEIDEAYAHISAFYPSIRESFLATMTRLRLAEEAMFKDAAAQTESVVLSFKDRMERFQSAMLGNALRETVDVIRSRYIEDMDRHMSDIIGRLNDIIASDETALLARHAERKAAVA